MLSTQVLADSYVSTVQAHIIYMLPKLLPSIYFFPQQDLTDLRDRFQCQLDYIVPGDFSEDRGRADQEPRNRDIYPSGCFFIENTFYNDFRSVGLQSDYIAIYADLEFDSSSIFPILLLCLFGSM